MSKQEKPLPKPPSTPFGRNRAFEGDNADNSLMADRLAMAAAEGKLEEFIQQELPQSDHARKLTEMMMGMTGMMPDGFSGNPAPPKKETGEKPDSESQSEVSSSDPPPEEVFDAVKKGDVKELMGILKKEHRKRQGDKGDLTEEKKPNKTTPQPEAAIEKETIENLIQIASENNLSLDWLFFRALKKYVAEYQKSGNL